MTASSPRPVEDRWCDIEGSHISLFCWVEQVIESLEPVALPSRGQVLGRGTDVLYVRFEDSDQLVSVPSRLLHLLPDGPGSY